MKNYSKKFAVFLSLVLMMSMLMPALSCISGTGETAEAATMKISQTTATVCLGDSLQLKVKNLPKNAKVTWSSNSKSIATVSSKGLVTALTPNSNAIITATVKYTQTIKKKKKTKTKKFKCTIITAYPPLERTLNVDEQHIGVGGTFELGVVDADIYDRITYSVRDMYVASVDSNGRVSGRMLGETEVYADVLSADGTQSCRLICKVEVVPTSQTRGLNYYSKDVEQFRSFTLQVTNASNVDWIEYSSDNSNIVSVSNTGTSYATVTGVSIGTAYITVRIKKNGNEVETKSCRIIVKEYNKTRSISATATSITKGVTTSQLSINGLDPLLDKVKYESVDKKVATVSDAGVVTGVAGGTTQIKATITFPTGETSVLTYDITVVEPPKETSSSKSK